MPHSFTQHVLDYLTARPHIYVGIEVLEVIGGKYAWRTRISDARFALKASGVGTIENKQTYIREGEKRWTISEYRFVPTDPDALPTRIEADGQVAFL